MVIFLSKSWIYDNKAYSEQEIFNLAKTNLKRRSTLKSLGLIKKGDGKKVLDVGCGMGAPASQLVQRGFEVVGVDILKESINVAKFLFKHPKLKFEVKDIIKQQYPAESFDTVLFLETIEHVDNPKMFLSEFHRILKPNGYLIISTPNAVSLFSIVRQLLRGKKRLKAISSEPQNTGTHLDHIYAWDIFTLCRLLDRSGFKYITHTYAESTPLNFMAPLLGRFRSTIILKVQKK